MGRDQSSILGGRLVHQATRAQDIGQLGAGRAVVGRQRNGTLQRLGGFLIAHTLDQHHAQVVPGHGQIGLKLAGVAQCGNGCLVLACGTQEGAQRVVVSGVLRPLRQRLSHGADSLAVLAAQTQYASLHA